MCNLQYGYFVYSDGTTIPSCNAKTTDSVQLRCYASFTSAEAGQQFYAKLIATKPDGTLYDIYSSIITVGSTQEFVSSNSLPLTAGTWKTNNFEIYTAQGALVCSGAGTGSGLCESITVTSTCPLISNCTLYGPVSATQGQQASFTASWTGGTAPYNADFYIETGYFMSATNISGTSATINPTIDATKFAVGNHTIFVNVWYRCSDGSAPNCQTAGLTFSVVAQCTTPSISFSLN